MSLQGDETASRHTSVSKRPGSTVSRAQTLIKRNIAANDLKPSDILIERFQAWKHIVKMLIAYFEGVADIENNTARELTKLGGVIQVPFKAGNQFLGEGGMQDVFYSIRDKTRLNADHHANFAKTVEGSIVQHLQKLRMEIKAHVKNVQNDTGKLAANVAREREFSTRAITDLSKAINTAKNSPMGVLARDDPYCANVLVHRQLLKQVHEENALQKSIILMQHNSANFEEGIVRSIQSAWQTFDEWQTRMITDVQETWRALAMAMGGVPPTREWVAFAGRSDHLLDPDTPLRNTEHIEYPGRDDPSVTPVHVGLLERKKRFTRTYAETYFVLTPAGYLHEYPSSDPRTHYWPTFSLFLPACTLGPPSSARTDRSHKFHIESRKDSVPGAGRFHIGSKEIAYTFRARSHEDMMEWWNDIRMLVARYLVASEAIERHGPIEAAVRAAGYMSEEEEEGGSSIEDEEDIDQDQYDAGQDGTVAIPYGHEEDNVGVAPETERQSEAPAYTAPAKQMAVTMGPNGYPVREKSKPEMY
ncbi:cytoplasm protein [Dacryopinax primogenitus]|uniref:Cytoplasm protein n=1 Tax=Dacryopinax primogenitus (strain DJM 731) TaxID=1858805 RepID=M5G3P9_DACPD|nr:cytoplasm protein [Dacryopinax primogenitus]EJU04866.1 cytoplasm protein [Dacryopinax primogenitus]